MFLYTYWMDMKRDRDGNYWGNMLGPADDDRVVLQRNKWYCLEHMIQVNDPGKANGELAAWIDGKLYIHYTGFRWRTTPDVKLKRFGIGVYVHNATQDNTVIVWVQRGTRRRTAQAAITRCPARAASTSRHGRPVRGSYDRPAPFDRLHS